MAEITIVVPVYNVEKFLKCCLDSILNQSFQDFQLILVNDGSTDNSGQICDEYQKKSEKVTVIHKKNGGLSSARNAGIESAKAPYIGFVDSDDYIEKDMFQVLYAAIKNHGADIASVDYLPVSENDFTAKDLEDSTISYEVFDETEVVSQLLVNEKIHRCAWNKLYKLELFENVRYPEGKVFEDTFTTYQLYRLAKKAVATNYKGYFYRQNDASITRKSFTPKNLDVLSETQKVLTDMEVNAPNLLEFEQARLAEHYVELVMKLLNAPKTKETKKYLDDVLRKIKNDYGMLRQNKRTKKKIRRAIVAMNIAPHAFFMSYRIFKKIRGIMG